MCTGMELALLSGGLNAVGAAQQAAAQRAQAEYQAQVATNNALIASQNEADVVQRGATEIERQRTRINQTIGTARAAMSGSGLMLNQAGDTYSRLQEDLAIAGTSDILTMKSNIEREARRARIEGTNFTAQAGLYNLQASSINPLFSAIVGGAEGFQSAGGIDLINIR